MARTRSASSSERNNARADPPDWGGDRFASAAANPVATNQHFGKIVLTAD